MSEFFFQFTCILGSVILPTDLIAYVFCQGSLNHNKLEKRLSSLRYLAFLFQMYVKFWWAGK